MCVLVTCGAGRRAMAPSAPDFNAVSRLLDALEKAQRQQWAAFLNTFWAYVPIDCASYLTLLRLLLPNAEKRPFGLRETRLACIAGRVLCGGREELKRWNESIGQELHLPRVGKKSTSLQSDCGDLSLLVQQQLAIRVGVRSGGVLGQPLTLNEVDAELDKLHVFYCSTDGLQSATASSRTDPQQEAVVTRLLLRCSPTEGKWLCRLLLRDLKLGARISDSMYPRAILDSLVPPCGPNCGLYSHFLYRSDLGDVSERAERARRLLGQRGRAEVSAGPCREWPLSRGVQHGTYVQTMNSRPVAGVRALPAAM
eukprot:6179167-Pleurochrysis_carterae.AAC.1